MRITIFGSGAWGTALAQAFVTTNEVTLWGRDEQDIETMRKHRENKRYLPGIRLHPQLKFSTDFKDAALEADFHLIATPLSGLRTTVRQLSQISSGTPLLWACKGLENDSGCLPHEIVAEELGSDTPCGVLTGPSFAHEVARGLPAAVVLASSDPNFATYWGQELHQPRLRIYANHDIIGCEIGGAIKNVIAIAAGVSDGMGLGLNARAALITRGLAEISRLAQAMGGRHDTLMGLAGMGDLILTCTGDLSRNRRVGLALAQGKTLSGILHDLGQVTEGVNTAHEVVKLAAHHHVEMPLCSAVDALLRQRLSAQAVVEHLLARQPKPE